MKRAFRLGIPVALGSDAGAYRVLHGQELRMSTGCFAGCWGTRCRIWMPVLPGRKEKSGNYFPGNGNKRRVFTKNITFLCGFFEL